LTDRIRSYFQSDADPGRLTLSSDSGQSGPETLLNQIRTAAQRESINFSRLISLVTKNTATVLKLQDRGSLAPGKAADVLVMDAGTLELKEVIAGGKRLMKHGRLEKTHGKI
jgi:beta-aspartyl-dipeptidase (metallo-type)